MYVDYYGSLRSSQVQVIFVSCIEKVLLDGTIFYQFALELCKSSVYAPSTQRLISA